MCEPITIGLLAAGVAGTGAVAGGATFAGVVSAAAIAGSAGLAIGAIEEQGEAQAEIARSNALIAQQQAQDAIARGRIEEEEFRRDAARFAGEQRALLGASGSVLEEGDPLDILESTAETTELDALTIRANAEREAAGFQAQSSISRFQAEQFRRQARFQSIGTGIGAGARLGFLANRGFFSGRGSPLRSR